MNSLREAAIREALSRLSAPDSPISARTLAQRVGLNPPVSFKDLFGMIAPEEITRHGDIVTPAGTALGGSVDMTLRSNGTYSVHFHMHDSGIPDYDFQVRVIFTTPGGLVLVAQHGGHVEGTGSLTPAHDPHRDDDHDESGTNPMIRLNWSDIQLGRLWITKDYSATGVAGFVEDVAHAVLDVAAWGVGEALGVVIALGAEVDQLFGDLGVGGAFGLVAGVVVFGAGGTVVMAIVAGVAIGAVTNALIKQRELSEQEAGFAAQVFGGSLPPHTQIMLTNLAGLGGRAFTMPGADGKIYINLGDAYDDQNSIGYMNQTYATPGQLLIHELTHVWQIHHRSFLPGTVCEGIVNQANNTVGESVYQYGPPGPSWGDAFGLEAQGAIVDQWFAGTPTIAVPNRTPMDVNDPYFIYIRDNIRVGRT